MNIKISPRQNGIHSLAEGLRAFEKFHLEHDLYAAKDAIIRSHHGLETLFKDMLFVVNPVLLLDGSIEVSKIVKAYGKYIRGGGGTIFDDERSIGLDGAIQRLNEFGMISGIEKSEYRIFIEGVEKLIGYRNQLQHLGLDVDQDVIGRVLGSVVPRSVEVLSSSMNGIYQERRKPFFPEESLGEELVKIFDGSIRIIELLRKEYDEAFKDAIKFFKDRTFEQQRLRLNIGDISAFDQNPRIEELEIDGFINFKLNRGDLAFAEKPHVETMVKFGIPKVSDIDPSTNYGIALGTIDAKLTVQLDAPKTLKLPDADEKIAVLRDVFVTISISLDYKAEAFSTEVHFGIDKVQSSNGKLIVSIDLVPKGSDAKSEKIIGKYEAILNETNAPFKLSAFHNLDGTFKMPRLEWYSNAVGNLVFS